MVVADEPFWRLLEIDSSGCWLWTGYRDEEGYGHYGPGRVHRIAWERSRGPIPAGLTIDHLCRVRHCANPDHLEPVTIAVNVSRGERATRTSCRSGHPYSSENTYIGRRGRWSFRKCRRCNAEAAKRYAERVR